MKAPEGWTLVFQGTRLEADLVMGVLEAAGLQPAATGGVGEITAVDVYDSQVYVPEVQAEAAREVLAERSGGA